MRQVRSRSCEPGELPPQVDVRQMSLFGACWTAGSFKYLAEAGTQSITFYETTGWRGVMETEAGSPLPELFRSLPGTVFPMYHSPGCHRRLCRRQDPSNPFQPPLTGCRIPPAPRSIGKIGNCQFFALSKRGAGRVGSRSGFAAQAG